MTEIKAVPFRERYMKCASCRSDATALITVDGKPGATACRRHVDLWVRRYSTGEVVLKPKASV